MVLKVILDLLPLDEIAEGCEICHSLLTQLARLQCRLIYNQVSASRELEQARLQSIGGVVLTRGELECVHSGETEGEQVTLEEKEGKEMEGGGGG